MKAELIPTEELIEGEEVTVWRLDQGNGRIIININKSFTNPNDTVTECEWIGEGHHFVSVNYSDWDSNELIAIMNLQGKMVRKGIRSIEEVLEKLQLFIVQMSGFAMNSEASAFEFGLAEDDWQMAVIDKYGTFIIAPEYDEVWFEEDENLFYARSRSGKEYRFSLTGDRIP